MIESTDTSEERRSLQIRRLVRRARANGTPDGVDGKRKAPRFRFCDSLEVTLSPDSDARPKTAKIHNVSSTGVAFWSKKWLTPKRRVFIRSFEDDGPSDWLPVEVCHCTRGIMGFLVGVEFQPDSGT